MNGLLALLGLEISFRERVQHKKAMDVKLLQISVSCFWQCDPTLHSVCSSTGDAILELLRVFGNLMLRLQNMFAHCFFVHHSMSLNIDMNKILPFKSHGLVDPKNAFLHPRK